MADSTPVLISLAIPTYFVNWDIQPRQGSLPLTVSFGGYLSPDSAGPLPAGTQPNLVNNETIHFQIQDAVGNWSDLAIVTTTSEPPFQGYFGGSYTFTSGTTVNVRLHYDGNIAKNLTGCERNSAEVQFAPTGMPNYLPLAIVGLGALALGIFLLSK